MSIFPDQSKAVLAPETDPLSGAIWAYDEDGVRWAGHGVFVMLKGFRVLQEALDYFWVTQPHTNAMYGPLAMTYLTAVWDAQQQQYHKYGVIRRVVQFEVDPQILNSSALKQPHFIEVDSGVGRSLSVYDVEKKVRSWLERLPSTSRTGKTPGGHII